jgi:NADH-quinone oxidoreductase subunit L
VGTLTALLTAFYMFRMLFTVFHSEQKEEHTLHSLPKSMTQPLVLLAFGSATAGFLGVNEAYGGSAAINNFLSLPDMQLHLSHTTEYMIGGLNVLLALLGMGLAYRLFAKNAQEAKENTMFRKLAINKFYIDEIYEFLIVKPLLAMSDLIEKVIDPKLFDGFINLNVWAYLGLAGLFAKLQNGKVRYYALYILAGVSLMSCYMLIKLGVM